MTAPVSKPWIPYTVALAAAVLVIGVGLGRFGIWQPAELRTADLARDDNAREARNRPPAQIAAVRLGFKYLGENESGGRLPTAILAILATMALAMAVGSASDPRAGALVGISYATMPLVFMNSRQMFGGGVAQSGFTLFFAALIYILWGRPPPGANARSDGSVAAPSPLFTYGRWALIAFGLLAASGAGWMLGVAPVLVGVGLAAVLRREHESRESRIAGALFAVAGVVLTVLCARAAISTSEAYNALTGAGPENHPPGTLPTYETLVEHIGHGLFPWTGIVAFGVVRLLVPPPMAGSRIGVNGELVAEDDAWRESGAKLAAFVTVVAAYGLQSFHLQQFGFTPFIAVAPLAVAAGFALRDAEREAKPWRIITAGATFLTVIVMRDFLLFPKSSYAALGLPDGGPSFPTGFTGNVKDWLKAHGVGAIGEVFKSTAPGEVYFVIEALLFIVIALSPLFQGGGTVATFGVTRPFAWMIDVEREARREMAEDPPDAPRFGVLRYLSGMAVLANLRIWVGGFCAAVIVLFGTLGVAVQLGSVTSVVRTVFLSIAALPIAIVLITYAILGLWNLYAMLGRTDSFAMRALGSRVMFVPLGGFIVALVISQLFVPALSEHMSPRGVWSVIRQVRRGEEPVARFGGNQTDRATRYYANFDVRDVASESEAVEWLRQRNPRHYLVVGADVFPSLNRAYRQAYPIGQRQNVPVIDATNSNLFVAASSATDRGSRNPLDRIVMSTDSLTRAGTDHWHPHGRRENNEFVTEPARFDDALEYLGYNLDSNNQSYVAVGGTFTITYHFKVLREISGNHQIFVHIDGQCPRINGDHEPAGGHYPVRHWLTGDYIHDEHRITIPGYCRGGRYFVYIGFFQGDDRMRVTGGDHDRENRVVAAIINVR